MRVSKWLLIGILILFVQSSSAQWVRTNGLMGQSVAALAVRDSNILAAIPNAYSGVFLSTNNGMTWTSELAREITCFAVDGNDILAGSSLVPGVYLSTTSGTSWTEINSGGPSISNVLCFAVNGNNIFAGTYAGVYLSTNNGASWTAIDSGLPIYSIQSLAVSGNNIFAAVTPPPQWYSPPVNDSIAPAPPSFTSGAYLSTDNGASWTAINSGLPNAVGFCFAVSGSNIFAGMDSGISGGGGGVYLSTNNGTSWTAIDSGLPNAAVFCFAVSGSNIFAGTAGGVYLSTNNGIRWTKVNSGLTDSTVSSITVIPVSSFAISGNTIFAGTNNGVWRRPISEMIPTNTHEFQNKQPSVSNVIITINKTNIAVTLPPSDGPLTIGLFTVAGKKIYSAIHQANRGSLNIPVSGLLTGTYLMSITGRNTSLSSSFVVTK